MRWVFTASLVTTSPDLTWPGVKNQLGSDMRRPLPWYTDTDTIFRSWPGPGYVSGDSRVSGRFCGICREQGHATRSQLHLKWTRTIYQCLMDRVLKIWMNTRDHVTCQNWQLGRSYPAPELVRYWVLHNWDTLCAAQVVSFLSLW